MMAEFGVAGGPNGATGPAFVEVVLEPEIRIGAGQTVVVPVLLRHWLPDPVILTVSVLGLDASWSPEPTAVGPLAPGTTTEIEFSLTAEQGALAARYPFVVAVQASGTSSSGTSSSGTSASARTNGASRPQAMVNAQVGMAEAVLVLDAPDRIGLTIEPLQPTAVFTKKIKITLTNPGREDRQFAVSARAATGARVTLEKSEIRLPAGRTVQLKGRVWVSKPSLIGSENSHAFSISGRGTGAPQHVEGILRARPLLRGWLTAGIAIILTIALWVGVALVAIPRITDYFKGDDSLTAAQAELEASSAESAQSSGATGSDTAGSGAAGEGEAGGAGGGAGGAPGAGEDAAGNPTDGARLSGTMLGADPEGVTVLVEPASVVQAAQVGAQAPPGLMNPGLIAGLRSDGPIGKVFGSALRQVAPEEPVGRRSTTSAEDGAWSFAGITGPGYYLVTFARPGFQTQRYIIDPAMLAGADPMKIELAAGQGKLSGTADSAAGPVGAATVTITDGTNSLETSTVSIGDDGQGGWEVNGLSTPGSYLVTVAAAGYGTTSALVELEAGAEEVVDLTLTPGVGSITGLVSGMDQFGVLGGLGGLTVTAVDGDLIRTANTVTAGAVGRFSLPDLPTPGNYTLTVSGTGYQPKTQQISLAEGAENASVDLTMTRSDGVVTGSVSDEALVGLPGVGLSLVGQDASFKTMTASSPAGSFRFSGVTPGLYVLSASQYGRQTSYATVEITAAETATADLILAVLAEGELAKDSRIRGRAVDARTGGPLTCDRAAEPNPDCRVTVRTTVDLLDGTGPREVVSQAGAGDDYNLPALDDTKTPGLLPGLYAVTVSAPGYEPVTINIQVAMSAIVPAPQVSLQPLGLISGTITAKEGTPNAPTCVVAVPSGAAVPTDCVITPAVDADSLPTCVAGTSRCAVTVNGAYEMRGFSAGGYELSAIPTDPEYLQSVQLPLQLDRGAAARYEPVLNRKPRMQVTVLYPDDITGALTPVVGIAVSLTDSTGAAVGVPLGSTVTNADGNILLSQLAEGIYTASVTLPAESEEPDNPVGRTLIGSVVAANVTINQTGAATVVVTAPLGPVVGRLQTTVDGLPQDLNGASVTITGITGYSGRSPVTSSVTLTTDAQGCYAVVPAGWAEEVSSAPADCSSPVLAPAALPLLNGSLVVRSVSVSIAEKPANTFPYQAAGVVINPPTAPSVTWIMDPITLAAKPSEFGSHQLVFNGPPITGASITVTTRAVGSGNVAVTFDPDGTMHWQDDQIIEADQVVPGRYKLRVEALGYSPLLFEVYCPLGNPCITTEAGQTTASDAVLVMRMLGTVSGTVTVPDTSNVAVNFADAVVSVVSTPSGVGAITVKVYPTDNPRVGQIEFRDSNFAALDPTTDTTDPTPTVGAGLAISGQYTFQVKVSGFDPYPVTVTCTAGTITGGVVTDGECSPFAAPLTQLPVGGGTVVIVPDLDAAALAELLPKVSLIVTKQAVATSVITATVNADGTINWQDSTLPAGLLQGGNYTVTASLPGYRSTSTEYSFLCSASSCTPGTITLRELPRPSAVIEVGSALPDGSAVAWTALVTTIVSRPGTAGGVTISATAVPGSTTRANLNWSDSQQPYAGVVPPGEYIVSFSLPGYEPSVRYRFVCNGSTSACVMSLASDAGATAINPQVITLSRFPGLGTITWDLDGDTTGLVPSIQVTGAPTGAAPITVTANPDIGKTITWTETGNPPGVVRVGPYQLTVSAAGFETQTYSFECNAGGCPTSSLVLRLSKPGGLVLDFVDAAGDAVLGATVTLSGTDIASNTVTLASSESQVTFGNISARNPNSYKVRVQAASFKFEEFNYQSTAVVCGGTPGLIIVSGGTACTVTLVSLGVLEGGVIGLTPSTIADAPPSEEPLAQVLMTATQVDSAGAAISGTTPFVERSTADGTFRVTGTSQKEGLANISTFYKLSAERAGYQKAEATVAYDASGTLSLVGAPSGWSITGGKLSISMTVNPVDLQVQLKLGATNVTDGVTLSLVAGTNVIATCPPGGVKCAVPVTGTSTYFTFIGVTPGVYTLQVVSSNAAYRSLNTQVIVYAGQAVQFATISLATGSSVVSGLVTIGPDEETVEGQEVWLVTEASPDAMFRTTQTDEDGLYSFDTVLDGRYQILIKRPGYDDWRSAVFTVNSGGDPNVQVAPARLGRATRTVAITVTSRADPTAILTGTTVSLAPTSADGLLADEPARTPVQVSGNVATFTSVPTGNWTAVVTTLAAPRAFSSGLFSTTVEVTALAAGAPATPATGAIQILDTAKKVAVNWTLNSCATAPTNLSAVLTRTNPPAGTTPPTPTLTLTVAGTSAESGTIYLPDGAYSAAISHAGTSGWSSVTDTFNLPATVPGDSDVPTITWEAVPVPVTVTLDGANASATTVLAHKTGAANADEDVELPLSGAPGSLCLEPDVSWDISVPGVGSTSYFGSLKTLTPTRATPGTYSYAGFSLVPEVALQEVPGRPGDTRTVSLQLFSGSPATGTALFTQSLAFAATETSQILPAGTTVYVGAGSYTWTATPATGDEFGAFSAAAVVSTASVSTTVELPYARVVAQVAVTRLTGTPPAATPQVGATATIKVGTATIFTGPTVAGGSTAVVYDLAPGTYIVTATWTSTATPPVTYTGALTPNPTVQAGTAVQIFPVPIA